MPKPIKRPFQLPTGSDGDFVTCKQGADLLKLSEISIRRMLTKKLLKRYKVGARTLIRRSELLGLVREAS